jgi:hypothetical protein
VAVNASRDGAPVFARFLLHVVPFFFGFSTMTIRLEQNMSRLCYRLLIPLFLWATSRCTAFHLSFRNRPRNPIRRSVSTNADHNGGTATPRTVVGPSAETKPDYDNIHGPLGPLADLIFKVVFRIKMAEKVGVDSTLSKVSVFDEKAAWQIASLLAFCQARQDGSDEYFLPASY